MSLYIDSILCPYSLENIEELNNNNKRISWPAWPSNVSDEPINTSQDEIEKQVIAPSSILFQREKAVSKTVII
jgi:hypothetical protein